MPVKISPQFDKNYQDIIRAAAAHIAYGSCIQFKFDFDPSSHPVHLNILKGQRECKSQVGYIRRSTTMYLDPTGCRKETLIHELLHVLGLYHMHTAPDRDNYITVNFDNIQPAAKGNFNKVTRDVSMFNTEYDFKVIII